MEKPSPIEFAQFANEFDHTRFTRPLGWPVQREQFPLTEEDVRPTLDLVLRSKVGAWLDKQPSFRTALEKFAQTNFYLNYNAAEQIFARARFTIDVGSALHFYLNHTPGVVQLEDLRKAEAAAATVLRSIEAGVGFADDSFTRDLYFRVLSFQETCRAYLNDAPRSPFPGRDDRTLELRWLALRLAQRFHKSFGSTVPSVIVDVLALEASDGSPQKMVEDVCKRFEAAISNTPGTLRVRTDPKGR